MSEYLIHESDMISIADAIREKTGKTDKISFDNMVSEISGISTGAELNFEVMSNPQPASPKENTVWVDTDTKITSWDFAATQPHRRSGNKNLNVYPYVGPDANAAANGITFTDNGDGSVTANGTASANTFYRCSNTHASSRFDLAPGVYTLSDVNGTTSCRSEIMLSYDNGASWAAAAACDNGAKTFTLEKPALARINIKIPSGKTVNNVRLYPQLENGSAATSFVKGDATGQVWITTGASRTVEFNALKKNGIQVYPMSAKQYVGGAWVDKTAKTYQGGEWTAWWSGEIYSNGVEYFPFTTPDFRSDKGFGAITRNEKSITFNGNGGSEAYLMTEKMDVSGYKAIKVTLPTVNTNGNSSVGFEVYVTTGTQYHSGTLATARYSTAGEYRLGLVEISEPCSIVFGAFSYSRDDVCVAELTDIRFELR